MDFHVTIMTCMSWKVVYVIKKVRQQFSKLRVSKIVAAVWWRADQTNKCCQLCCEFIDSWTT